MQLTCFKMLLLFSLAFCLTSPAQARIAVPGTGMESTMEPSKKEKKRTTLRERITRRVLERQLRRLLKEWEKTQPAQDSCDIIVLRDSSIIWAKVLGENAEYVRYLDCDYPEAPINHGYWADILEVRMANGSIKHPPAYINDPDHIRMEKKATAALTASLVGLGCVLTTILAPIGIIFSLVGLVAALKVRSKDPQNTKAKWALGISLFTIGLLLFVVFLVIVALSF